jgi:hypothetical protein
MVVPMKITQMTMKKERIHTSLVDIIRFALAINTTTVDT